jgi:hypothetical protein
MLAMGFAAVAAFSVPLALQAHDSSSGRDGRSQMMGSGMMNRMGQMSDMMDHCNGMMQGASARPNEQWRDGTPRTGGQSQSKQ